MDRDASTLAVERNKSVNINTVEREVAARRLQQFGVALFLLALFTGLAVPSLSNPRMALASHVEGLMNGMFLILLGLLWAKLVLSRPLLALTFWLAIYGTFANWLVTLLAAAWPAGSPMMPLAGRGHSGTAVQEAIVKGLLVSLSLATIGVCALVLFGLRNPRPKSSDAYRLNL